MRGYIPPQNSEENVFVKKAIHTLELAEGLQKPQFTLFMDLRQQQLFAAQANKYPDINVDYLCGYDGDGERRIAAVYPEHFDVDYLTLPIVVLKTELNDDKVSHKDFLGAAMG